MAKRRQNNEVVRVEPQQHRQPQSHPPAVSQVQVIQDPNTGQHVQVVYDANSGQYIPVAAMPTQVPGQAAPTPNTRGSFLGDNAIGTHKRKRIRVVEHPDGTRAYELDVDEAEVNSRTVSDETHRAMYGGNQIPNTMSKKRLIIGGLLALLVLMVLADIVGTPHVRTAPGEYAGLEGTKTIANTDAPIVILKRLDRSVFLYTMDGIGWVFSSLGSGDNSENVPQDV